MKKIYIFAAVLALLTLSLNAQLKANKKGVVQPTTTTEKKVDMPQDGLKMYLQPEGFRAPKRATVEHTSTLTFTAKCNGAGTADDGVAWTVTSDGTESTFDSTRGIHYGTNSASVGYIELRTSDIPGTVKSVVVNASRGSSTTAYVNVTVNGAQFGSGAQTLTTSNAAYTFTGEASGSILVRIYKNSSATRALYCKSIAVTYETEEGGGAETTDLTVCDGQSYAQYFPYFGYYHDDSEHIQMIYPASILGSSMAGKAITAMTFYPTAGSVTWSDGTTESASGINFYNGTISFKIANLTNAGAFDADNPSFVNATLTAVSTINMPSSANTSATTWVITFDQPFTYTGGDLLIDVTNPTTGQWGLTFFAGDNTGDNAYSYITSGGPSGALAFLPKVTFTYEGAPDPVHDLGIALSAQPTAVGAGNAITLTATVTNTGNQTEEGYTVTFTAGGTTIATQTASEPLAAGATATFTTTYTPTEAQAGQTVNFGASVACTDDADATNNDATASAQVITLPPPENVAATPDGNSGTMTWDAPIIAPVPGTLIWDFEEEADFTAFTTIDSDGDGYNWAWHYNDNTSGSNLEVHSGNGQIYSQSYDKATSTVLYPDNWLISPEVTLGGTLSFWACGQDPNQYWNEVFAVYVCVGSYNGVSDFIKISPDITTTHAMTEYSYDLSQYQGQGYFAIRHYNVHDEFYLVVDDITLETMLPGEQPTSYNIYQEGQLVGNVDANTFSYTFNNLNDGTYNCAVSAVYSYGESAAVPTTFTIDTTNPTIEISPATQTISDAAAGALTVTGTDIDGNINVSAASNDWTVNPTSLGNTGGNVSVTYTGRDLSATTTVTASATGATDASATVDYVADLYIVGDFGSGWDFSNGTNMSYNNGIYTATLTVNANDYILFARLLGNSNPWNTRDVFGPVSEGNWGMQGDSYGGNIDLNDDDPIHFPEGGTYRITIDANNGAFTITKLSGEQTAQPVITYSLSSDGQHVTITATGDGTVTLTVPGHDPVSGQGEASITIPCGAVSNTITVTATAQEDGKDESDPATQQITIPAGSDWVEMDGTYDNPNDLLSFLKDGKDIMMVDQFVAETKNNDHPDHYTYTLRQTVNGETQTSTPVSIPVYKTNSTMQGLYTKNQVDVVDKNMSLRPNVVNTEMDFDVNPDRNVLYYSLYRGDLNATYPEITAQSRVSQLQKFEEMVGEGENAQPQYFLFESHPQGIAPRYDRLGTAIAERLDTNWVEAGYDDQLAYVPVIWTYGLYSARGDGKNNSYGSDIKREYMGQVTAEITGQYTDVNGAYGAYSTFDVNGVDYIIYHPEIKVTGNLPRNNDNNVVHYKDEDEATYVPYLCRAWCTYEGIRDFGRDADGNLVDRGALPTPYWLGDAIFDGSNTATIGGEWTGGSERDQWSFGVPANTDPSNVTFIIRFYYKKVVTEGQPQQNGSQGKFIGGAAEEYFMAQTEGNADDMVVALNEFMNGIVPVDVTYVNPQGMQSSRPFDGVNIVVTRYSDGSTRTSKIVR